MIATSVRGRVRALGAAVSVRCAALLEGPVQGLDVIAVFPAAVYLATQHPRADVIALLAADAVVHPAAFVLSTPVAADPFSDLDRSTPAAIGSGRLTVGDREFHVGRWYDPVPRSRVPAEAALAAAVTRLRGAGGRNPGGLGREGLGRLADALARDDAGDAITAVDTMLGSGPGLTPTGDDQLAGLLATLHHLRGGIPPRGAEAAVHVHVRTHARSRTTLLSAALLEHALDGAVAAPVGRLLRSLTTDAGPYERPSVRAAGRAIDEVLDIGATSGRDLLDGIMIAFGIAAAGRPVAPGPRPTIDDEGAS